VTSAWHKQICQKASSAYRNKAGIAEIFGDIHKIMKMEAAADKASSIEAVRLAMDAFLAKWDGLGEKAIYEYFKKEWSPRIGAQPSYDVCYKHARACAQPAIVATCLGR
jgi:hypothetical protein